jgi:hypothetical protein
MIRDPVNTLRRYGGKAEEEEPVGATRELIRRGRPQTPSAASDLPWQGAGLPWDEEEDTEEAAKQAERQEGRRAFRAALVLAAMPVILILLEEFLFPSLSRPLAWFSFAAVLLEENPFLIPLLALIMGGLFLVEWLFIPVLVITVAEMYDQEAEFRKARDLYARTQTPRIAVGAVLLLLVGTGLIQPLFFIWWLVGGLWGGLLLWLTGREVYNWRGLGNILLTAGYALFQGLVFVVYVLFH